MNSGYLWLGAVILFMVVEGVTVSLVSIWFAIGSAAAFITSLFTPSFWIQLAVFSLVSVISMALIRPLAQKFLIPRRHPTNADRILGQEGVVVETIDNRKAQGRVSVSGMEWTARSRENTPIPVDTPVTILEIEGVKVLVSPAVSAEYKEA